MRTKIAIAGLMLLAACGGDASPTSTTASTATSAPEQTSTTVTTTAAPTTTAPPTTTEAPDSSTATTVPATPTIDDGRPATFVAITDDYFAVEVDTLTGEILHVFGQTGTAEQMAAAEEMPPNVLVGAWRNRDGSVVGLSDCCEPAAGRLFYVEAGGDLGDDPYTESQPWNTGWTISPSPADERFASVGYSLEVHDPGARSTDGAGVWIDEPSLGFPNGAAAWTRDGSQLYWTTQLKEVTALATHVLAEDEPSHVTVLPWVGVHQFLDGIGTQASGNLVGFLHTYGDTEVAETEGVVFSTVGEVLANFPVETGSLWGGYDPTGKFLIYVDGENTVRWQGAGQAGSLGDGFIFASW